MWALKCPAQQYAWGKIGRDSAVARFRENVEIDLMSKEAKQESTKGFEIDETKPYAELWMGTHPSGPALICTDEGEIPLLEFLSKNPHYIGSVPGDYPSDDLPFMFKVLSIKSALSIQAHPDRKLAQKLHAEFPDVYKDGNHKPEMAIALTEFEGMNGFRPVIEIKNHFLRYPELAKICGERAVAAINVLAPDDGEYVWKDEVFSSSGLGSIRCNANSDYGVRGSAEWGALRDMVKHLLDFPADEGAELLASLVARLEKERQVATARERDLPYIKDLILRLNAQYPGDRGILFPLLLNTVHMRPGQSFYMGANEPHAYIYGDILECMALSDNVVRVGLTPKFKDKETMFHMLHYHSCNVNFLKDIRVDPCTYVYRPPIASCAEFEIERVVIPREYTYSLLCHSCGSICIFLEGSGSASDTILRYEGNGLRGETEAVPAYGASTFMAAGVTLTVTTKSMGLELYRAHVNLGDVGRSRVSSANDLLGLVGE